MGGAFGVVCFLFIYLSLFMLLVLLFDFFYMYHFAFMFVMDEKSVSGSNKIDEIESLNQTKLK